MMSFRIRLILLLSALLVIFVGITSLALVANTRAALFEQANRTALRISSILAQSASFGQQLMDDTENLIGDLMVGQAKITSAYVGAAERGGMTRTDIINQLKAIIDTTALDEFWITDEKGHAYITTVPNVDFTFSSDPIKQPQAHVFWPLLEGKNVVIQKATRREIDDQIFKYVGVSGVDKPRIVELGVKLDFLEKLSKRMGMEAIIQSLVGVGDVNSIRVFNNKSELITKANVFGADKRDIPSSEEREHLQKVIASGASRSSLTKTTVTVFAPVKNEKETIGATIVELSTRRLQEILNQQENSAFYAVLISLFCGVIISVGVAHRATSPLKSLGLAAQSIEQGTYAPLILEKIHHRKDEFGLLAVSFDKMAKEVLGREERLSELVDERTKALRDAHQRIDDELKTAQSFQRTILPLRVHKTNNYEIFGVMHPAKEMSGDFYDYFMIDENRLFFVIADVAGKGIPAALFMMLARTALLTVAAEDGDPAHMISRLNQILIKNNPIDIFITTLLGIYDTQTGEINFANGGHLLPKIIRTNARVETMPSCGGIALGILDDQKYLNSKACLQPGDTLFLYTDGVTEAFNPEGEQFGDNRLDVALSEHNFVSAECMAAHILNKVTEFAHELEQADDTTTLVLRRTRNGS
ncbi:MAG: PP2C family protein-serine/threonine phosphatase [Hyphomicrobium sp.]